MEHPLSAVCPFVERFNYLLMAFVSHNAAKGGASGSKAPRCPFCDEEVSLGFTIPPRLYLIEKEMLSRCKISTDKIRIKKNPGLALWYPEDLPTFAMFCRLHDEHDAESDQNLIPVGSDDMLALWFRIRDEDVMTHLYSLISQWDTSTQFQKLCQVKERLASRGVMKLSNIAKERYTMSRVGRCVSWLALQLILTSRIALVRVVSLYSER
jgi:hypothetical protein